MGLGICRSTGIGVSLIQALHPSTLYVLVLVLSYRVCMYCTILIIHAYRYHSDGTD